MPRALRGAALRAWGRAGLPGLRALLLLGAGCATLQPSLGADAAVEVEEVRLQFLSDRAAEARLVLGVRGVPGRGAGGGGGAAGGLRATGLDWQLRLGGRPFAVGTQRVATPLGPGSARVEVVLPLAYAPGPVEPRAVPLAVAVQGTLTVEGPGGGPVRLPFRRAEVLRLAGAPREPAVPEPVLR